MTKYMTKLEFLVKLGRIDDMSETLIEAFKGYNVRDQLNINATELMQILQSAALAYEWPDAEIEQMVKLLTV